MIFCREVVNIKLLTLNTHSHSEENQKDKLNELVKGILKEKPDIIALQEVNQSIIAEKISVDDLHFQSRNDIIIKSDNYAYLISEELKKQGHKYYWTWLPVKKGYEKFDEGLAILSYNPIEKADICILSKTNDYNNWKKRMALGIKVKDEWYYCVHMGWFDDEEEPFKMQWETINSHIGDMKNAWLLGDFNSDAKETDKGYDLIKKSGWYDSYEIAREKDSGFTVQKNIDGWNNKAVDNMRIDYIFSNVKRNIKTSYTIYNGKNFGVVSDHYGVIIEV